MTEKKTERIPPECFALVANFDQREELEVRHAIDLLAGTRKYGDNARKGWQERVRQAIAAGHLIAREEVTMWAPSCPPIIRNANPWLNASPEWSSSDLREPAPDTDYHRVVRFVSRADLATWLHSIGESGNTLGACIRVWIGWKEAAPTTGADKPPGKVEVAQAEIKRVLADVRKRDPDLSMDEQGRYVMPGQYAGFHGLCIGAMRKHYGKDTQFSVTTERFKDFCKGVCTFQQDGSPRSDDLEYYKKMAIQMGVSWVQPTPPKPRAKLRSQPG